ncbi:Ribonuclease Z (plasmid) [Variovorax sp. SRS16]|uniref:MBL fold metallo-hydrolase n=1 Tax=Variovorax sp. SRS16 TaxID=282217 RepID=UPI0013187C70|nr:MBL fold metallo-hydrolase [Variovorax sp. SRS16]VTU46702.1 Ribonuclease Z [Variovorax sp. SRS16]
MQLYRRQWLKLVTASAALSTLGVGQALAQPTQGGKTRLILLGTGGGPTPLPTRNQPASVLIINDEPYVIDAGNAVGRQLALAGIGLQRVGKIFITHHHDDHNADLGTLMGLAWSNGRSAPIDAYGPPGIKDMIQAYLEYFKPNTELRMKYDGRNVDPKTLFRGHDTQPGFVYQDKNVKVTCAENAHYPNHGHDGAEHHLSYGYRFESADRVVVFSGDTAASDAVVALAKDADVLVHEVIDVERTTDLFTKKFAEQGRTPEETKRVLKAVISIHTSVEEVGRIAKAAGVKTVVLNHFVPGFDPTITDDMWAEGVRKNFTGKIVVGRDLMEI